MKNIMCVTIAVAVIVFIVAMKARRKVHDYITAQVYQENVRREYFRKYVNQISIPIPIPTDNNVTVIKKEKGETK